MGAAARMGQLRRMSCNHGIPARGASRIVAVSATAAETTSTLTSSGVARRRTAPILVTGLMASMKLVI